VLVWTLGATFWDGAIEPDPKPKSSPSFSELCSVGEGFDGEGREAVAWPGW